MLNVSGEQVEQAKKDTIWSLGNETLYKLCAEHPYHQADQDIVAKIWLIGRVYAATIERRQRKGKTLPNNDWFYRHEVVSKFKESQIDMYIQRLQTESHMTRDNLSSILETHAYLTNLFYEISGQWKRSLASKYLHFHLPMLFFIYDGRAKQGIKRLMPEHKSLLNIKGYSREYTWFSLTVFDLNEKLENICGTKLTPREIDNLLLAV